MAIYIINTITNSINDIINTVLLYICSRSYNGGYKYSNFGNFTPYSKLSPKSA